MLSPQASPTPETGKSQAATEKKTEEKFTLGYHGLQDHRT